MQESSGLPTLLNLLETPGLADLISKGRPGIQSESALRQEVGAVLSGPKQPLVLAAILLWHDHSDAAHRIVQDVHTPDGSLLHAILHRREPDFGNANYWFRRCERHPSFTALARQAQPLLTRLGRAGSAVISHGGWNGSAFVDLVEQVAESGDRNAEELLKQIQKLEFSSFLEEFYAR
ncbi:MAG: hypothetical protein SFY81_09925 [Verrucomicrobiota bacterium]|nr:hypothetical protein [Verrucomicrobiota bacterium]